MGDIKKWDREIRLGWGNRIIVEGDRKGKKKTAQILLR
jgi:hypothetical protein